MMKELIMTKEASSNLCTNITFLVNLSFLCSIGRKSCSCAFTTPVLSLSFIFKEQNKFYKNMNLIRKLNK